MVSGHSSLLTLYGIELQSSVQNIYFIVNLNQHVTQTLILCRRKGESFLEGVALAAISQYDQQIVNDKKIGGGQEDNTNITLYIIT